MQHEYQPGDEVITTKGYRGTISEIEVVIEFKEPEFSNYSLVEYDPIKGTENDWLFENNETGETKILVKDLDFVFRLRNLVKFKNKNTWFFSEALRPFDKPYIVVTVADELGRQHTFIEDESHNPIVKRSKMAYISSKLLSPSKYAQHA